MAMMRKIMMKMMMVVRHDVSGENCYFVVAVTEHHDEGNLGKE